MIQSLNGYYTFGFSVYKLHSLSNLSLGVVYCNTGQKPANIVQDVDIPYHHFYPIGPITPETMSISSSFKAFLPLDTQNALIAG